MSTSKQLLNISICLLLAIGASAAYGAETIGQINAKTVVVDGVRMPAASTLFSGSVVTAVDEPALIYLANGHVLLLAAGSSAQLAQIVPGVEVTLLSGSASYRSQSGAVEQLDTAKTFLLANAMSASSADGDYGICVLPKKTDQATIDACVKTPADDSCEWNYMDVAADKVSEMLSRGVTFVDLDQLNDFTSMNEVSGAELQVYDCRGPAGAAAVGAAAAAGGLSGKAIAAITVGSVLGAVVLVDALDDDDKPASTRVQ